MKIMQESFHLLPNSIKISAFNSTNFMNFNDYHIYL